jgi:hypothetical protein
MELEFQEIPVFGHLLKSGMELAVNCSGTFWNFKGRAQTKVDG